MTGTVKWFSARSGSGFITSEDVDYFAHVTWIVRVPGQKRSLHPGDQVSFNPTSPERGSAAPCAKNILILKRALVDPMDL